MDRLAHVDRRVTVGSARRVAVIGGGYAGMAAATALTRSGIHVTIFETAQVLGGRARRIAYRGQVLDNGQHILSGAYTCLRQLMRTVGVADEALDQTRLQLSMPPGFLLRAPNWPAPFHMLGALLSARGLAWRERWAAVRLMLGLRRANFRVDASLTVAELLHKFRQPANLAVHLWNPLTVSALNTPPQQASAQVFANVLRDALAGSREASDLLLPRIDLSSLFPQAAADWVTARGAEVRLGARVTSIEIDGNDYLVKTEGNTGRFNGVILAIGPHQFGGLLLPPGVQAPDFAYEPIVTVYCHFEQPVQLSSPMIGQASGTVQWFFDRPRLAGATGGTIAAVISASGDHRSLSNEELSARVLSELSRHVASLPGPAWTKVVTEKFATFACSPASQARRPPSQTSSPGFWLAGDYVAGDYPATLESAVRSGVHAATLAQNHFNSHPVQ